MCKYVFTWDFGLRLTTFDESKCLNQAEDRVAYTAYAWRWKKDMIFEEEDEWEEGEDEEWEEEEW
jgi:hypothetical protein